MSGSSVVADVRVRAPQEADLPTIADLLTQLGYPTKPEQARRRFELLDASSADQVRVAEVDARVVGLAVLHVAGHIEKDAPHGELTALVTEAGVRRRGVARALLGAIEELARGERCEVLFVRSNKRRDDAHSFYRSLGYEETHLTFNKAL